ncbi:fibronectin type III domain-containing protein [Flavobacterium hauense]
MKKFTLLIIVSLLSICGYAQGLPLESFETPWVGTPPAPPGPPGLTNWTVINEVGPAVTWIQQTTTNQKPSHTGSYSAFLDNDNVCATCPIPRDWLITPYFVMPANAQLRFFSRLTLTLDQGSIYKVKISTDPNPANLAAYTDLQTWSETTLNNPLQTTYYEKVLTLPAITGSVHIAFVMEGKNMDRWLIDDVKVTSQCIDPSAFSVTGTTMTSGSLTWTNNGGAAASAWEIEVVQELLSPTGTGEIHTGPPPYTKNGLTPDTTYKAYIRAKCSDGGESNWIGPVYFDTAKLGEDCSYPLVVTPLPFSTSNNTSNFADHYEGGPGTTCGATGTYLSGNDVVYEYTPTVSGNLNIKLTNTVTGAAMFVYDNCADIGIACIGGGIGNVDIASLPVIAGNSIYIVISSSSAVATTPYTLSIQQVFCAPSTGLTAANMTASSADLSWAAGTYTAWQLAVVPAGSGLPTGNGIDVTSNAVTVSSTSAGVPFTSSTCYEYYLRSNCNDGNFSIWAGPFGFCTTQIPDNIPYAQNWETEPNGWTLLNTNQNNKWAIGTAVSNASTKSLYISNDNGLTNTYTITSASVSHAYRDLIIPSGATSLNLAFDWKCVGEAGNDYIRAYLIPINVLPVPGTQLANAAPNLKIGGDLTGNAAWSTFNGVVNVTGLGGTPRRLVLEWRNNAFTGTQPPAAIDNINFTVITCPAPSNPVIVANTLTNSTVNISWTVPTSVPANGYDYYLTTSSTDTPLAGTLPTGTSATTTATGVAIQPSTNYFFWVRANCGTGDTSTWSGPLNFISPQIPAPMDYVQNFDLGPHGWALSNGNQTNKWVVGTAVNNSATSSLYISQDNGVTNTYNINATSAVHAYRDITIPPGVDQLELSFDWKNNCESTTYDWLKVWIAPTAFTPVPGNQMTTANAIQIGGALSLNNNWTNQTLLIQAAQLGIGNSTRRLIFEFRNDPSIGDQAPAAVDNINFKVIACPLPSALVMNTLTMAQATFAWTAPFTGSSSYDYYLAPDSTVPTSATIPTGTTSTNALTLNSLPPSTSYCLWVRNNCSTSTSKWIGPVCFITPQIPATIDYTQNFDMNPHNWDFVNGTQANKWVVGTAVSNSAPNSLYITNDNGASNAYNVATLSVVHAYRDITFPPVGDQFQFSFDWKSVGEANLDYFKIWLVPTSFIPVPGTPIGAAAGRIPVGGNFQDSSIWTTSNTILPATGLLGQTMRLVFEWRNSAGGGTQPPAAIDNINFKLITCPTPSNIQMPSNNAAGITFTWTPPTVLPIGYEYYYTQTQTPPGPTTTPSGSVGTPSVTLSGLPASSNYYFWVRDNCGDTDKSLWIGPFEFSTPLNPVSLNYDENFNGPTHGWITKSTTAVNKWVVGSAVSNGSGKSLYISNTGGATHNYVITSASVVHAYKDFIVPPGTTSLDFSFDWKNLGQSGVDYIKVWRVPSGYVPPNNALIPTAGDRELLATLSNNANWTTANYVLNSTGYANTTMRIVFEWRNDTFTGSQPPGAIDNINLSIVTCPKPTTLSATLPTQVGATFNWTEIGTADNWEVYVTEPGQPAPNASSIAVSAPSKPFAYTTPALEPSTNYVYYVRSVCSTSDKSKWAGPFPFKTAIGNDECTGAYTLQTNAVNHDCEQFSTAMYNGATPSPQPFNCGGTNGGDVWYEFVATSERHEISLTEFGIKELVNGAQPVIIELYQGEVCGSLLLVGCATTNVMMAKNLAPGTTYKVRVYLNATTGNQNITFKICVNTPAPPSAGGADNCAITTINPSFEYPVLPTQAPTSWPHTEIDQSIVPGWRTTATDQRMEFWTVPNYENHPGYEGRQFVELNAYQASGLYQDYESPSGTIFTYTFGHKGRIGQDTCEVQAGPPGGPYVSIQTASTGKEAWATYTGTYTAPLDQPVTRFIFKAVSTFTNDISTGNFLDGIDFKANNSIVSVSDSDLTCINNTTTVVGAGAGEWGALATNPGETIIENPGANTTTISGFTASGDYYFSWTTQNCTSTIKVTYNNGNVPPPVAITTIDYCEGETPTALSATAIDNNTLYWYTTETGGTSDTTAPTPDTTVPGTTVYYVSQYTVLECESPRTAITVNVYPIPATPVVPVTAIEYCEDATAAPLVATALAGNTLNWYTVPTGGTASTTAPTPSTADAGVTSYFVSQVSPNSCESARTEIVVTVNGSDIPLTGFTLIDRVCIEDVNPIPVPDAGHTTGGYYSSQAGLVINPATGEIDLAASTPNTYTVTYTITANPAVCKIGGSTSVQIIIDPLAPAVTDFSYTTPVCGDTANQLPLLATGFTAGGTFTANNGLIIDTVTGEVNIAANAPGDYTIVYTVDQSVPNCVAAGVSSTTLSIIPVFTPVTTFDYANSFCYNGADASPNLAPDFTPGGTYKGTSGLIIDAATGLVDISGSAPGTHTVTYTFAGDPVNCIKNGESSYTFTIGTELGFGFNGECDGSSYVVTASPTNGNFDDNGPSVSFKWSTKSGSTIGTDTYTLNVTEYANSTPETDTFPMEVLLTVTVDGCETTRSFIVDGIACTIQKGISPNSDGFNDYFDLEFMGVKKLTIYNRYGQDVYSKDNYKKEWIGQNSKGDELPTGTYYFVIERSAGGSETGWIYINRQD